MPADPNRAKEILAETQIDSSRLAAGPHAPPDGSATVDHTQPLETAGTAIAGRYKLIEKIGEGGMGEVWVARQEEPVKRKVALKLIKAGMDSKAVLARFEQERQALAMMDHPHIAKVLDGGLTADRRPFFAMELVDGSPLTRFCDEARLGIRERLLLFVSICQAVQHAHQKGIVHRDLKPSNILVSLCDGRPAPKVIDFGLVKATGGKLTDASMATQFGAMVGTLDYMAPEQAGFSATDVDTRADIYSLGVILYELLTGLKPFDTERLRQATAYEMLRIIREEEPPRPSTRLSTDASWPSLAALRRTEPRKLTELMRGELDWVVMKCLEKDRGRRYETANGLARDVERYLADEAVEARPPSAGYRLRKFARRNKGPVLAAALVFLALLGGVIGTTIGLVEARRQRDMADRARKDEFDARQRESQRAEAEALANRNAKVERDRALEAEQDTAAFADFLAHHVLSATRPEGVQRGVGANITLAEALTKAEEKIPEVFRGRPKAEALARFEIGVTWRNLGRFEQAERHLKQAVQLRAEHLGPTHDDTLTAMNSLAVVLNGLDKPGEAIALHEQVLAAQRGRAGGRDASVLVTLDNLAAAHEDAGYDQKALALREEVLEALRERQGPNHLDTLICLDGLARSYRKLGQFERAIELHRQALAAFEKHYGSDHPNTLTCRGNLGMTLHLTGQLDLAMPLFESALAGRLKKLGADHRDTLSSMVILARGCLDSKQFDRALLLYEESLAGRRRVLGEDHPETLSSMTRLAAAYETTRQPDKAVPLLEDALRRLQSKRGADHPETLDALNQLGVLHLNANRPAESRVWFEESWKQTSARFGPNHVKTIAAANNLAVAHWRLAEFDKAIPLLERVLEARKVDPGPTHATTLFTQFDLAVNYRDAGRLQESLDLLKSVEALTNERDSASELARESTLALAGVYERMEKFDLAEPFRVRLLEGERRRSVGDHPKVARSLASLGANLVKQEKWAEAERVLLECLTIREEKEPSVWTTFYTKSQIGFALLGQKKYAAAEPLLLAGYEGLQQREAALPATAKVRLTEALQRLVQLYEAWDKADEAAQWRKKLPVSNSP